MKNQIQCGEVLALTAPVGGVVSGNGYKIGNIFGIAAAAAVAGDKFSLVVEGAFAITKKANDTFSEGDYAYWDNTNMYITSTSSGNTKVGVAIAGALAADATVAVRLNEAF